MECNIKRPSSRLKNLSFSNIESFVGKGKNGNVFNLDFLIYRYMVAIKCLFDIILFASVVCMYVKKIFLN